MKTIFTTILLAVSLMSYAQPTWLWAERGGGTLYESNASVAVDANGMVYSAGGFESAVATFNSQTLTNAMADSLDAFVVQYDQAGTIQWARRAGGVREDVVTSMTDHINGGVVVTGYFFSPTITFGTFTLNNLSGYSDAFLVHYDATGNVVWAQNFGGIYDDQPAAIATDQSGNIYLTGFFLADTLLFGSDTLLCNGTYDVFVLKFDSAGNPIWGRSEGTAGNERGTALTTDQNGNVIVGGVFNSGPFAYGTTILTYEGGAYSDIFLAKYDSNGNLTWARDEGGTYLDEPQSLATDMFDNIYMAAMVYSDTIVIGSDVLLNSGIVAYCDIVLAKYNPAGLPQWAKIFGVGTGNDIVTCVAIESGQHPFITGIHGPNINFGNGPLSGIGCFLTRFDGTGQLQWVDNTIDAYGSDLLIANNGDIFLSGLIFNTSTTFSGTFPMVNAGVYDVFVAVASQTIGVTESAGSSDLGIYPNPASDQLFIRSSNSAIGKVSILNLQGEVVYTGNFNQINVTIDVSTLSNGIYMFQVDGVNTKKITIVR